MELNLGDWEMKPKQSIPKELIENWEHAYDELHNTQWRK